MEQLNIDEISKELVELEKRVALIKKDVEYYENKLTPSKVESVIARRKGILLQLNEQVSKGEKRLEFIRDLLKAGVN